ncbi:mitochondrial ribosome and complex I assembly factor AltMIEF1 [Topomyia yanbarensis]|uniref:mitochondrial ribosome and complex I assembly factor AltMIEF1 n=1 Tax=Topomyia yanbarensis TaxID=2498891 RepID=UPI00273BB4EC|nr:mitochondrial ribosome and complex I assembly factor AltMIEF1 [Topomyia yanbarensis]XP_058832932.1 mitochondrial ribosome and complex I assembly factor AltMIEF1 [Topomyia yanbarensis]
MTIPSVTSKRLVLRLYRDLCRYGSQLQFTDREYFLQRVRREFDQNRNVTDLKEIEFCYKRGRTLLEQARVI